MIFPSAEFAQRLIQGNQLLQIDRDKLKNADTVYPALRQALVRPGLGAHDPYTLYATGLGYRADKISGHDRLLDATS